MTILEVVTQKYERHKAERIFKPKGRARTARTRSCGDSGTCPGRTRYLRLINSSYVQAPIVNRQQLINVK